MNTEVSAFIDEIRSHPKFDAAPATIKHNFDTAERALQRMYARGADDPASIEMFDRITDAARSDGGLKARLDILLKVLIDIRRGLKIL
jgi:hypothetical protein